MPNTTSATKALRQSERKRIRNVKRKKGLREVLKQFEKAVAAKNATEATALLPKAQKAIDKAAKNHLFTKNTASRKKSRMTARIKKIS